MSKMIKVLVASMTILAIIGVAVLEVYSEKEVEVLLDGEKKELVTRAVTVGQALDEMGIEIRDEDVVNRNLESRIRPRGTEEVVITTAKPVIFMVNGKKKELMVPVPSVEAILAQEGVSLQSGDRVETNLWPQGDLDDRFIKITNVDEEVAEKSEERERVDVASRGGAPELEQSEQSDVGELERVLAEAKEVYSMESTAYTHTGNKTFTGIYPYEGVVAVDPEVIPLGSKLYVEGYGSALAADTGGLIKGEIVDVFMDTREEALRWGRRDVDVYLLETPE